VSLKTCQLSIGDNKAHIEKRFGSQIQAIEYCKKDGKFKEFGERREQGGNPDVKDLIQNIYEGKFEYDEFLLENPETYHKYGRTIEKAIERSNTKIKRDFETKILWYWGKSGVGKTKSAYEYAETHKYKIYEYPYEKGLWWDNYRSEEIVLFDDFSKSSIDYKFLLRLADRYPLTVPIRGKAPVPFLSKLIIITSDIDPKKMFWKTGDDNFYKQLLRRIDEVIEIVDEEESKSDNDSDTDSE